MKTSTRSIKNSILRSARLAATHLIALLLAFFALSPTAQAIRLGPDQSYNTAQGSRALQSLRTGAAFNTAIGGYALSSNTIGGCNTATGTNALRFNATGMDNTANGVQALENLTTGSTNIAMGYCAGMNLTTGDRNIDIGNPGAASDAATIRIGNALIQTATFIAGIREKTTANANAIPVVIDSYGQLGTTSSSRRFKDEIKPMNQTSEAILRLKPATFHYKSDSTGTPQFGLIAEEVAEVNPDLVVRDDKGEIYTVRYDAVNAMLLNEFLKEHRKVEAQEATITELKKDFRAAIAKLNARLKEQDSKIQKVSAQVEVSKPAPQTVANNQ